MAEEITMNSKSLEVKRHFIKDKLIIGIDPAKKKHQAVILASQMNSNLVEQFYFSRSCFPF